MTAFLTNHPYLSAAIVGVVWAAIIALMAVADIRERRELIESDMEEEDGE